jgi:zinc protease
MKLAIAVYLTIFTLCLSPAFAVEGTRIKYEQFTLKNGLKVVVNEDRKAPVVAVNVWYHVGSKDEPQGKSGFAHLFEHLMFNGSENYNDDYFKPLQEIGARNINGTTSRDRTNYYQTVPIGGLDRVLWMESDRMGHLMGAIDDAKIIEQRDVVKNEKRQGENRPGGQITENIFQGLFPLGHPYHHSTIGSMDDLDNASTEDVKSWFSKYYGPNNAVIALSGDIDVETARILMEKYFAHIPPSGPLTRKTSWIPTRTNNTYEIMNDHVSQTYLTWAWAVPGRTSQEFAQLEVAAEIFGGGRNSRLYKNLVHEEQRINSGSADLIAGELSSIFIISVELKLNDDVEEISQIVEKMWAEYLEKGPTKKELNRIKSIIENSMIRGLESISGKADLLASGAIYANDPGFIDKKQVWQSATTQKDVKAVTNKWLKNGYYKLTTEPYGILKATDQIVDRSVLPDLTSKAKITLPPLQHTILDNGIKVTLIERHDTPIVNFALKFDAGSVTDYSTKYGTADFTFGNMNEGTKSLPSLEYADQKTILGAEINFNNGRDSSSISLSALKKNLHQSVELWADIIQNPGFNPIDIERDRALTLASLESAKVSPNAIASNILSIVLYGSDHVYSGKTFADQEVAIRKLTKDDLVHFHKSWVRPDNATLYIVGDTTIEEITAELNKNIGKWKTPNEPKGQKDITDAKFTQKARILLVDKPEAVQSIIIAAHLVNPVDDEDDFNIKAMNSILGGDFTSRINMNLRENKGWSYGAGSSISRSIRQSSFRMNASVQTDKTAESMLEMTKEVRAYQLESPPTQNELDLMVKGNTLPLPGRFSSNRSLLGYIMGNEIYGRPYNYAQTLEEKYEALTPELLQQTAKATLRPDEMIWVIVGDLKKIENKIRELNLGEVEIWDVNGKIK